MWLQLDGKQEIMRIQTPTSDLILSDVESQIEGHSDCEGLILVKEPD